jgi:putative membrane protein
MALDVIINLLIFVHIVAFVAGGSNSVVGPVIGARMASATPEVRAGYIGVMNTLGQVGKVAMVTLLISGPLIMFLKYGGLDGASIWFWIKMALVALMLASIIYGGIQFKAGQAGDAAAGRRAGMAHRVTGLALLGVLLSAVLAFN